MRDRIGGTWQDVAHRLVWPRPLGEISIRRNIALGYPSMRLLRQSARR